MLSGTQRNGRSWPEAKVATHALNDRFRSGSRRLSIPRLVMSEKRSHFSVEAKLTFDPKPPSSETLLRGRTSFGSGQRPSHVLLTRGWPAIRSRP